MTTQIEETPPVPCSVLFGVRLRPEDCEPLFAGPLPHEPAARRALVQPPGEGDDLRHPVLAGCLRGDK